MKNYLGHTIGFTSLLLCMLMGLYLIPEGTSIGGFSLRRMDIFSDIRITRGELPIPSPSPALPDTLLINPEDTLEMAQDSMLRDSLVSGPLPAKDSSVFGMIIEDYSFHQDGLASLFQAIDRIKNG